MGYIQTHKARVVLGVVFGGVLIVLTILIFARTDKKGAGTANILLTPPITPSVKEEPVAPIASSQKKFTELPLPKLQFASYEVATEKPTKPDVVKILQFKSSFSALDAQVLANNLRLKPSKVDDLATKVLILSEEGKGMLNFDKTNGTFFYYTGGNTFSYPSSTSMQAAESFIEDSGLQDGTVGCTSWYKKRDLEETFVECHRLWRKVGYPIFNTLGTLNLPSSLSLASVRLGQTDITKKDEEIIASSDNTPGFSRSNDFNTITVVVSPNRSIRAVTSLVRPLEEESRVKNEGIKSPEEALRDVYEGSSSFQLVRPSGEGTPNLEKIPENALVQGPTAIISDFVLAYIENPASEIQTTMELAYVFRGKAQTSSGYDVDFVQITSAVKNSPHRVLGTQSSIQYGTFSFSSTPTPTPFVPTQFVPTTTPIPTPYPTLTPQPTLVPLIIETVAPTVRPTSLPTIAPTVRPTVFVPTPSPTPINSLDCSHYEYAYTLPNGAKLVVVDDQEARSFLYVPAPGEDFSLSSLLSRPEGTGWRGSVDSYLAAGGDPLTVESDIARNVALNYLQTLGITVGKQIIAYCAPLESNICLLTERVPHEVKCYPLGLVSPRIYLYSNDRTPASVQVQPQGGVYYNNPAFSNREENKWTLTVEHGRVKLDDGDYYDSLYYEYNGASLHSHLQDTKNTRGSVVVTKTTLLDYIKHTLSPRLGLTSREEADLITETRREIKTLRDGFVTVSLVGEKIINRFLPLHISPKPNSVSRVHLLLEEGKVQHPLKALFVTPIVRSAYTVVETGVVVIETQEEN